MLRAQFPLVHARLKLTVVNQPSLVYPNSNPNSNPNPNPNPNQVVNQLSLVYEWVGEEETLPPYALYLVNMVRVRVRQELGNLNPNPNPNPYPYPSPYSNQVRRLRPPRRGPHA